MKRITVISIALLSLSSLLGTIRGLRMIFDPGGESILFRYDKEILEVAGLANYALIGWVVLFLVGIFSMVVVVCIVRKVRFFPYLIIIEGIFISFLALLNFTIAGFSPIHLFIGAISIGVLTVGMWQTPKEF